MELARRASIRRSATRASRRRRRCSSRRSTPTSQRNNQLQPPASFLIPSATRNDVVTSKSATSACRGSAAYACRGIPRTPSSNSFLNSYNPLLRSGLSFNLSQPLLRDLKTTAPARNSIESHQSHNRRHPSAGERRPHHGRGENGLLESGLGSRERRRARRRSDARRGLVV